mgnify:FL=1
MKFVLSEEGITVKFAGATQFYIGVTIGEAVKLFISDLENGFAYFPQHF